MKTASELREHLKELFKKQYPDDYVEEQSQKILVLIHKQIEGITSCEQINLSVSYPPFESRMLRLAVLENVQSVLEDLGYEVAFFENLRMTINWSLPHGK